MIFVYKFTQQKPGLEYAEKWTRSWLEKVYEDYKLIRSTKS